MDNRALNIRGRGHDQLKNALRVAFDQFGQLSKPGSTKAAGYVVDPKYGVLLMAWPPEHGEGFVPFLGAHTSDSTANVIRDWLASLDYSKWEFQQDAMDYEPEGMDGSCEKGWRVYVDDWGHIGSGFTGNNPYYTSPALICAVTPSWLWYGK